MKFATSVVVKVTLDVKSWLVLTYTSANKSFGSLLKRSLSLLEVHLPLRLPTLLMVVVMMVRYRISSHLNLKQFSILALIYTQPRNSLYDSIRESIGPSDLSSIFISQEVVRDAISQLKSGKHDGSILMSNHFIYSKDALSAPLSWLFTAMLRHGIVPDTPRDCILVPIPKSGKDPSSSDSYRPIALAPILSKVFEWCLLFQFQSCFITSSLQFGFKSGFSADLCTGLLKNVIQNYLECDTHVYGCFLDASKAFNRVDHALLFEKLLQ